MEPLIARRAVALGVAQGAAEVVPVSSSAQLVLLPWLLRWEQPADRTTFAAALHAGSCAGIALALRRELTPTALVVAGATSVPAAVAGLLMADAVEERLGRPPQLAALLAGFGALMWWADARAEAASVDPPGPTSLLDAPGVSRSDRGGGGRQQGAGRGTAGSALGVSPRQAALAAVAQCAALVPGVSRSGAALTALRAAGVPRAPAERFSLLMSLPVTAGAAGLTLARARSVPPGAVAGAVAAAIAGAVATRALLARPGRPLRGAALYRLGLAAVVARRLIREGAA